MIYLQFIRFLLPLMLALMVQGLSGQFLNGGMARVPRATETLAAYGLAWGLTDFLASPLSQVRQVGLVLANSYRSLRRIRVFVIASGLGLASILALLALGAPGSWVIETLHGAHAPLAQVVRQGLLCFVPVPVIEAWSRLYSGLLLQVRRTEVVSYATLASIGASMLAVFFLLPVPFVRQRPILLPVLAVYAGYLVNLGILAWGYRRYVRRVLPDSGEGDPTYPEILSFFWPLALVMAIQGLSRPLINLFVSRGPDGAEALAALAVIYPLAHMPYGWLNEIRSLPAAFDRLRNSRLYIRRFAAGCGMLSFSVMVLLFWTPLRRHILEDLIAVEPELAALCAVPLVIFSWFPLVVAVRAYLNGVALVERRTRVLAPSAPARIGIILAALVALPAVGLHGATRGVAALLSGFVLETATVWAGVRGWGIGSKKKDA